jgi:iron(III) transport system substrate-binding protein
MLDVSTRTANRRWLLRWSLVSGSAALLAACAPTAAPAQPTGAPAPAAAPTAAPTTAPATPASTAPARWGMTADQEAAWKQVEDAANKEGAFTLYSLGSIPQNQVETLQQLFAKDYPNIKVNYLFVGRSSEEAARVTAEQQSKNYTADVLDSSFRSALVLDHSFLDAFVPPASQDKSIKWVYNPIANSQPPNLVSSSAATFFAIWINKDLLDPAEAPKNFMDVASKPKWKGQIIWQTPWVSGGGQHLYRFAKEMYGPDWVTKMQAQGPVYNDDQDAALLQLARGEYAVALGLTGRTASQLLKDGQPIQAIWPTDFVVQNSNGNPLAAHAPHPNAGKVFINWLFTEPAQRMWQALGQYPNRSDIPPAEDWMKGAATSGKIVENLLPADQEAINEKAAATDFKK